MPTDGRAAVFNGGEIMPESQDDPPKAQDPQSMPCSKCGAKLTLAHIEPDQPGYDRRTFECRGCGHSETKVIAIGG